MTLYPVAYDSTKRIWKRNATAWPGFVDNEYDVTVDQTQFTLGSGTVSASNQIDVFHNGILKRESIDYTRNVGSNRIDFSFTVKPNSWVRIRVW